MKMRVSIPFYINNKRHMIASLSQSQHTGSTSLSLIESIKSAAEICEQLSQQMQKGYYQTIKLAYKTWNFNCETIRQGSRRISSNSSHNGVETDAGDVGSQAIYMPQAVLVGNIYKLEELSLKDGEKSQELLKVRFKATLDSKEKLLLIQRSEYRTNFVKHFNRMLKNKNEKYLLTNLSPVVYSHNTQGQDIYFLIQPITQLIHLTEQYYQAHLKPIERLLDQDFRFSNLKLSKIYSVDELDKNCKDGFVLAQVRQKFEAREKDNITVVGLLTMLERDAERQKGKSNKKQIMLWLTEVLFRKNNPNDKNTAIKVPEIGCCKIIIRYSPSDQSEIEQLFSIGHSYLISGPQIMITETANIIYLVNISKNSTKNSTIIRLSNQAVEIYNMEIGYNRKGSNRNQFSLEEVENTLGVELETVKIGSLLEKSINRNIVKLHVGLIQVEMIYGSIRCQKCGVEIRKNEELDRMVENYEKSDQTSDLLDEDMKEFECRSTHRQSHCLQLWGIVRAADSSGLCLLSMEHRQIITFLELQPYLEMLQKQVQIHGRGRTLYTSNRPKQLQTITPLIRFQEQVRKSYVEKGVIGKCKTELEKTFRESLTETEQLEYHDSFQNSKKYLQQRKIFPNGIIEKRGEQMLMLPFLKVFQVLNEGW